jgi:acetyltransferase-like isoleucine patch superfamily enzyme
VFFKPAQYPRSGNAVPFIGMAIVGCLPSPLKRLYYRMKGAVIEKNVSLGMFSYIESPQIHLHDGVKVAPFTFIRARVKCIIGKRSCINSFTAIDTGIFTMGQDSVILEQVTIGGMLTSRSSLVIGDRVKIFPYSFINPTEPIIIEDEVGIGGGNYIFTHGSWQSVLDGFPAGFGPVTLKRGVWLPWRVFILPNVTIGEYATIGAGAVINKDIPPRSLAVGSPAKVIKTGNEYIRFHSDEQKHKMLLSWCEEFANLLNYLGKKTLYSDINSRAILDISYFGKKRSSVQFLYTRSADELNSPLPCFLLSLNRISPEIRHEFRQKNCVWFDLSSCECLFSDHPMWSEIRKFLSRYGVRFSVVN